ncbi:MAG: hypothetical protein ACR2FS_17580 [Phormidesmis sp.]
MKYFAVQSRWKRSFAVALSLFFLHTLPTSAGDLLSQLTSPVYQDSVAIGEILSRRKKQLVFEHSRVLLGHRLPRTVTLTGFTPSQIEDLSPGDFAVLFLSKGNSRGLYTLGQNVFKVTSPEPSEAKILTGPLGGADRLAYNWFINSCGKDREFAFDYSGEKAVVYTRQANSLHPIGILRDNQWKTLADPPVCEPVRFGWWSSLLQKLGL